MSATVAVVQTSAVGVGVAVDIVGTTAFQQVKLVGGEAGVSSPVGATAGAPAAGSTGLIVALKDGASVTAGVSGVVSVSGSVGVSGVVTISPTVLTVNTAATIAGASVIAQVSGQVTIASTAVVTLATGGTLATVLGTLLATIANIAPVTTAVSVSVSGLPVWLNPTQQVAVSGLVGVSVNALVTGPVSVSNVVPVTTAASVSVTGLPVWLNPTQQVAVSGLVGVSVNALVTGPVSISNVVPVTTAASVSVTGLPIWWNPTAQVVVSGLVGHSVTGSVNIVSQALVSIAGVVAVTTAASVSVTGMPVWLNPTQPINISAVVPVTTQASVSVTGIPVWWNPTATIVVSGQVVATTTQTAATGALMWLGATQTMAIVSTVGTVASILNFPYVTTAWATGVSTAELVIAKDVARTNWICNITATQGGASSMMLFTVMTGNTTGAAAGTSLYVVPAGRILCIQNVFIVAVSSAILGPAQLVVVVGSAAASISLTATVGMALVMPYAMQATTAFYNKPALGYVSAGSTMGIAISGTSHSIIGAVLDGYLF